MGGGRGHEQQGGTDRATGLDTVGDQHIDDAAVFAALMSGTQATPAEVAHVLRTHPQQRSMIMTQLQQRFGNAFAQQVVSAMATETLIHGPAPAPDPTPEIVSNGGKLADAADQYLALVQSLLTPYTRARDALDGVAVADIGRSALGSLQLVGAALEAIDKQLARKLPIAASSANGDLAEELDHAADLEKLDALRARRTTLQVQSDSLQMAVLSTFTPMTFRGQPIPDVLMGAIDVNKAGHLDASAAATKEWQHTYALLQLLDKLGKTFATPGSRHDASKLTEARMELTSVAGRPMDFAFMRQALMGTGLWYDLNQDDPMAAVPGMPTVREKRHGALDTEVCTDDGPLTELYKETKERAAQTGWVEKVGPVTGSIEAPERVAQAPTTLAKSLPEGAKIVDMEGDEWVRYETSDGTERIRFRAKDAYVGTAEPRKGRNYSADSRATVMPNRKVGATEGVHRVVGSSNGDVIPADVGGVIGQPGVLDYEYRQMNITPDEMHEVKSTPMQIDYNEPDVAKDATMAERKKKGWE